MACSSDTPSPRTVLITGCNRGIGLEATKLFAASGARLICCTRNKNADFEATAAALAQEYHTTIELVYFDLDSDSSIKAALQPLVRDFVKERRRIDVLVNNAGMAAGGLLQMTSIDKVREVFQINFFAQVLITQIVSRLMMRQKSGSIINMGSVAGLDNFAGYTAYGASKAALMAWTRTVARELAPYGIRVNAVAPALTDTGMAAEMETKAYQEMVGRTDLQRLAQPREIAQAIVWLASEQASFVTGQVLRVDGGM